MDKFSEYIADTNPANELSFFEIDAVVFSVDGVVTFESSSQRVYTVRCSTNPVNEICIDVVIDEPGAGVNLDIGVTNESDEALVLDCSLTAIHYVLIPRAGRIGWWLNR